VSRENRKYLREEAAKHDQAQVCFGSDSQLQLSRPRVFTESTGIPLNKLVTCPFCLRDNRLQLFLISTKKGISHSRALCPECKEGMMMRSLLTEWTPESYASWVFGYAHSGFWQKVHWETWRRRLQEKGWSQGFWDRYKALKGEAQETGEYESYVDRMNRQGEEAAAEWNREDQEAP
jgi:uncharacterized Zn-finger protein